MCPIMHAGPVDYPRPNLEPIQKVPIDYCNSSDVGSFWVVSIV